ncbi:ScyD/ScyE family protein [Citricoccus sp. SGAir0253]|uniref:ScyD/ScyE family protein n=1 Tax=Citricoccus sp. SGAir0253 TaxID=2567881 RepID=UPI00143CE0CB|nr:ScyD/ScyE family protein [Citricoccus sp. SGAir0253]
MRTKPLLAGAGALALATTLVGAPAQAHESPRPPRAHELASGLVSPLSLDLGRRGDVYVTQNFAGALSKVDRRGTVTDVHRGNLAELAGVAYDRGATYHVETNAPEGGTPTSHVIKTARDGMRTVVSDDFMKYERDHNPDGDETYGFVRLRGTCAAQLDAFQDSLADLAGPGGGTPQFARYTGIEESHAYQLEVDRGTIYVADAAANAILKVNERTKRISTVAVIPATPVRFTAAMETYLEETIEGALQQQGQERDIDMPDCLVGQRYVPEPVPTDVVKGGRGELFVSTLGGGVGEATAQSKVYRIEQRRGPDRVTTVARGLFGATGLDRAPNGDLYVAEMFGGEISRLKAHDVRHAHHGHTAKAWTVVKAETPADVKVSGHHLYATIKALSPTGGDLVRYDLKNRRP